MNINKKNIINALENLIIEYNLRNSISDTHEWYLFNNTIKYIYSLKTVNTPSDIKNAAITYGMFCTESMDWDTELYKECVALMKMGHKLARVSTAS